MDRAGGKNITFEIALDHDTMRFDRTVNASARGYDEIALDRHITFDRAFHGQVSLSHDSALNRNAAAERGGGFEFVLAHQPTSL